MNLILKNFLRKLRDAAKEIIDFFERLMAGKLHLPSYTLRNFAGPYKSFESVGEEFVKYFKELCYLKPDEKILDIGSGSGRIALPLTKYLTEKGSYTGVDVGKKAVKWCQKNISSKYPWFHFFHSDLKNKTYNPKGKCLAKDYKFPFENESFDFIFLTSVFTHMLPEDMKNYIAEISRMLKKDGRCLITFFLLNQAQNNLSKQNKNQINFKYNFGQCWIQNKEFPENAVAYDEEYILKLFKENNIEITDIKYGNWSGKPDSFSFQDILILKK